MIWNACVLLFGKIRGFLSKLVMFDEEWGYFLTIPPRFAWRTTFLLIIC